MKDPEYHSYALILAGFESTRMNAFIHVWLRSVLREKVVTSSALGYCESHLSQLPVTTTITLHIP